MPKKAVKSKKNIRTIACKYLESINSISNAGNPLCHCSKRLFNLSPYNIVCQICNLYKPNAQDLSHTDMYVADDAKNFVYNIDDLEINDDDFEEEIDDDIEFEEIPKKKKKTSKKAKVVPDEEDDDEFEIEKIVPEEEEGLVIGHEKEDVEEEIDYEDEREEGLGKKHGSLGKDDEEEEDEELEDELGEIDDDLEEDLADGDSFESGASNEESGEGINFEEDVIAKIKFIGSGENKKEICPFCQKSKLSVLRHITKCKRATPEIIAAYTKYKASKKKSTRKKKSTKKKTA